LLFEFTSTVLVILTCITQLPICASTESAAVLALTTLSSSIVNTISNNESLDLSSDSSFESNTEIEVSTTEIGLQQLQGCVDTYMPGTLPECLYKQVQLAHETIDSAYQLTPDIFEPTVVELQAVAL
jgi:hypothetical protein